MKSTSTEDIILFMGAYPLFRKTSVVHAALALTDGVVDTLEGKMEYKANEHYLVSDDPPTHVWPVRRDIFEKTYTKVGGD